MLPAIAAATVMSRVATLRSPLGADEGGFLLVASQWHPGTSLYGDYWVDRPPLLIAIFALAHALGGTLALRLIGCVAAATTVVLAGVLGRQVAGRRAGWWVALATAGLVSTPVHDAREVSGELLALPFVLAGVVLWLRARDHEPGARRALTFAASGTAGAAAFLVKQSFVDVFVFVGVLSVVDRLLRPRRGPRLMTGLGAFAGGAVATTALVLGAAAGRGTSLPGLWNAIVVFRAEAAHVIATSASAATAERATRFPGAMLVTGAAFVLVLFVLRCVLVRTDRLAWAAGAMLAWEIVGMVGGASFWLHYLLAMVPGLAVALSLVLAPGERRQAPEVRPWVPRVGRLAAAWAAASALVILVEQGAHPVVTSPTLVAAEWLEDHRAPGDTVVVAYGNPNLLAESDTTSPYQNLWSLPVRVRDPYLRDMAHVLAGPNAPDWLLAYRTFDAWALHPGHLERVVARDYRRVRRVCGWLVYLRNGVQRPYQGPRTCAALLATG